MKFQRIKNIREDMELTQQQVADKLKVSRGTYSMWETANDIIPLKKLNELANLFDVSLDYILELTNIKSYGSVPVEIDNQVVGNNLYNIRKELGLSQNKLATTLSTNQSSWSEYEKGKYLIPTLIIYEMAKKYNLSIDRILGKIK